MRINPTTSGPGVSTLEKKKLGRISQIIGPALNVAFPSSKLPNIYNALVVKGRDTIVQEINVTCEVHQLLGNNRVRAAAMSTWSNERNGSDWSSSKCSRPIDTCTTSPIHISAPAFIQ
ncbi:hypothetical protein EUGRSUZ_F02916 [Eucalyptus grandis]|uniref:H(+)-transporting two-sector ATPase n=2 Tax=Eucalyptus grandis TaxID=71139 RepID=A0A059BV15_EUCGR|nr:hypothetical protein EUGRSUZ_F02916 [Eucalyptus grandis]